MRSITYHRRHLLQLNKLENQRKQINTFITKINFNKRKNVLPGFLAPAGGPLKNLKNN